MKNLLKFVTIGLFMAISKTYAAPTVIVTTLTGAVLGWGGEGLYMNIPGTDSSQGCSVTNQLVIAYDNPRFKESVAMALQVISGGSTANITVDNCYNNRPKVLAMGVNG